MSVNAQMPEGGNTTRAGWRFPAEFEPHESIWLAWPRYENKRGMPSEPVLLELMEVLTRSVAVDLLVQDSSERLQVGALIRSANIDSGRVRLHEVAHADIWMRDMGPQFLVSEDRDQSVLSCGFNRWGYESVDSEMAVVDASVGPSVAQLLGLPSVVSALVAEGGNHDFNGSGTMLATKAVATQRNPRWDSESMAVELKAIYGCEQLLWLEEGVAEDDLSFAGPLPGDVFTPITTGGHIDEFARFADAQTILLAEVTENEAANDPIAELSRARLEVNRRILESSVNADGEPFCIRRMPCPDPILVSMEPGDAVYDYLSGLNFQCGEFPEGQPIRVVAAASYLNFLVTNGLVLMPTYFRPGTHARVRDKDERARAMIEEAFPGREVVGVDVLPLNLGGGGMHCVTQQQPATTGS